MKFDIPEADLRRLYLDELRGQAEIAKIYGCTAQTISTRLRKYGIETRPLNSQKIIDRKRGVILSKKDLKIIPGEPIDCELQGEKCIYRTRAYFKNTYLCDYCNMTGKLRGCDPEQCTKYRFKERKKAK